MPVTFIYARKRMNRHLWAFVRFCRRKGDTIVVDKDLVIIERNDG